MARGRPTRDRDGELAAARKVGARLRSIDARRTWTDSERAELMKQGLLTYQEAEDL